MEKPAIAPHAEPANAGMAALTASGVVFREIELADGTVARWRQPALADWERPRRKTVHLEQY